jgi:formylglycine-generating enzyme required for sulfatase activity
LAITKEQAKELIECINENDIPKFFEQIDSYMTAHTPEISQLKREYISGRYGFDFYDRLKSCVNLLANTNFATVSPKYDIFFSFSSKNLTEAEDIAVKLRKSGLRVFFSKDSLEDQSGKYFLREIKEALKKSQHFLLLCTPEAIDSAYVQDECETFLQTYVESRKERRIFILRGIGFQLSLLEKVNFENIQTTELSTVFRILGKEQPQDDLNERMAEYKALFLDYYKDDIITEAERSILERTKKNLQLPNEIVMSIENAVVWERERQKEKEELEKEKAWLRAEKERLAKEAEEKQRLERERLEKEIEDKRIAQELSDWTRTMAEKERLEREAQENAKKEEEIKNKVVREDTDNGKQNPENQTFQKFDSVPKLQTTQQQVQTTISPKNKTLLGVGIGTVVLLLSIFGIYQYNKIDSEKQARAKQIQDSLYAVKQADSTRIADSTQNVLALAQAYQDSVNREDSIDQKYGLPKMIKVEGGTFKMGSSQGESDERPIHEVMISTFYMAEIEVTQKLWKAVMGTNPSYFKGEDRPVEQISWHDTQNFIKKLNQLTGRKYRLPIETEWEYAARGGNQSKGFTYSGSNKIGEVAWYNGNSGNVTHGVKQKTPNELGIYDMSGNVWEWCEDFYDENFYTKVKNGKANHPNKNRANYCVLRGGSWFNYFADNCRVANRYGINPSSRFSYIGFRIVLPVN